MMLTIETHQIRHSHHTNSHLILLQVCLFE